MPLEKSEGIFFLQILGSPGLRIYIQFVYVNFWFQTDVAQKYERLIEIQYTLFVIRYQLLAEYQRLTD